MKIVIVVRLAAAAAVDFGMLVVQPTTLAVPTAPLVMSFDNAPWRSYERFEHYFENDIEMSPYINHYDMIGTIGEFRAENGYVHIDTYGGDCAIKFALANGGLFHLTSLEVILPDPLFANCAFGFSDGSTLIPDPLQGTILSNGKILLSNQFAGLPALTYFTCSISAPDYPDSQFGTYLDNITLTPVTLVPEPTTFALLGISCLMLARWRAPRGAAPIS